MRVLLILCFLFSGFLPSIGSVIPKDTSFTVHSAFLKEQKKFPFIQIAEPLVFDLIQSHLDCVYASRGDRELHLDLFCPESNGERFPVVVLIHGGGWRSGSRSHQIPMATRLAAHGFVGVAVEYRLSPEALYPASIYDIKAAIRWLRSQSDRFPVDTSRIAVLGCSSGAQVATLIGCTNGLETFEGSGGYAGYSSDVQAIVNMDGVVDFTCPEALKYENDPRKNPSAAGAWLGGDYETKPELWTEASPVYYVNANTPPILFVNSSMPRFHAGRDAMLAKMDSLSIYNEVHTLPDTPHPFWLFHPWFEQCVEIVVGFLGKVF